MKIALPNLALFQRSLLLDNRHWQSYLYRFFMLAILFFGIINWLLTSGVLLRNAPGLQFLSVIAYVNLLAITFFAISVFSSAITEEKEIDALGLILMTGITPFGILLSKGTAKLMLGLILILSQVPFVLLSVTFGGVTLFQVFSVFVVLLTYMILLNNVALFFSVIFSKTASVAATLFFIFSAFNCLTPIWKASRWLSPFYKIDRILQTFSSEPLWSMQASVYTATALFFFILSSLIFDSFSRKSHWGRHKKVSGCLQSTKRSWFRPKRVWGSSRALLWKAFYFDMGGKYSIILINLVMFAVAGIAIYYMPNRHNADEIGGVILMTGFITLFVEGIYISDSIFHTEVWGKTLSTLLLLPESIQTIAYRKIAGGLPIIIPTLIYLFIGAVLLGDDFFRPFTSGHIEVPLGFMILFLTIICYYHLVAYFSLIIKYGAFIIAGFIMMGAYMMIMTLLMMISLGGRGIGEPGFIMFLIIIFYIPLIVWLHTMIGRKVALLASVN